jgi:hypothetical protein
MSVALHLELMPYFFWSILKGNVDNSDVSDNSDLVVLLACLLEYIMADKLSFADIYIFEEQVVDYFEMRALCVQQYESFIRMTPKYHHLGKDLLMLLYFVHIYIRY